MGSNTITIYKSQGSEWRRTMNSNVPIPRISRDTLLAIIAKQNKLLEFCLVMGVTGLSEQDKLSIYKIKKLLEREGFISPTNKEPF